MASRGLLGGLAGLGQGIAEAGRATGEALKFQYMQDLQEQRIQAQNDRADNIRQETWDREDSIRQDEIDRKAAEKAVRTEIVTEGGKHYKVAFNAEGQEVSREQFTPPVNNKFNIKGDYMINQETGDLTPLNNGGSGGGGTSGKRQYMDPWLRERLDVIDDELNRMVGDDGFVSEENQAQVNKLRQERDELIRTRGQGGGASSKPSRADSLVDSILFNSQGGKGLLGGAGSTKPTDAPTRGASQPPQAAIEALRKDPGLAEQFKSKYNVDPSQYLQEQESGEPGPLARMWDTAFAEPVEAVGGAVKRGVEGMQEGAREHAARQMYDHYVKQGRTPPAEYVESAWPYLSEEERSEALAALPENKRRQFTQSVSQR